MPRVGAADEHCGAHRDRFADRALVGQRPGGLEGAAEEDVRRAAEQHAAALGLGGQRRRVGRPRRERLLRVDVLARRECGPRHLDVRRRRGQVQHDPDRRIGDQLVDLEQVEPVVGRERRRERALEVGTRDDLERVERRRVLGVVLRDHPAADDPHVHTATPLTAASDRSTASSAGPSVASCSTRSHSTPASIAAGSTRS